MALETAISGMVRAMLSTWSIVFLVTESEVAGGMSTTPMIVPVSSLGTRAVGVIDMSHTRTPTATPTMEKLVILWLMKNFDHF